MAEMCPKCGNITLADNGKCNTCGYKKNKVITSVKMKSTISKVEQANTINNIQQNESTTNSIQQKKVVSTTKNPVSSDTPDLMSHDSYKGHRNKGDEDRSDNTAGFLNLIKAKFVYTFSKERKIEKKIPIDIDLNFDSYYNDVLGSEPCIAEGIDIITALKLSGSILSYVALVVFLIYWL